MPRPKTHEERTVMINRIIELVKEQGRITTKDVVAMFNLHRTTAEKYIRIDENREQGLVFDTDPANDKGGTSAEAKEPGAPPSESQRKK